MKLTKMQIDALAELDRFEKRMAAGTPFWWRQARMRMLAERGFVVAWHPRKPSAKLMAHRLTDAGRAALKEQA